MRAGLVHGRQHRGQRAPSWFCLWALIQALRPLYFLAHVKHSTAEQDTGRGVLHQPTAFFLQHLQHSRSSRAHRLHGAQGGQHVLIHLPLPLSKLLRRARGHCQGCQRCDGCLGRQRLLAELRLRRCSSGAGTSKAVIKVKLKVNGEEIPGALRQSPAGGWRSRAAGCGWRCPLWHRLGGCAATCQCPLRRQPPARRTRGGRRWGGGRRPGGLWALRCGRVIQQRGCNGRCH
mmetsp:Transcript_74010/g.217166  ORF Transcript_74010/g.217166 Transcript_74010/m.217166 type:complete len:232 (+) Transcript_74010:645-1340(+)